jgi:HlyD family secretion protein
MTGPTKPDLPLDLNLAPDKPRPPRRWFGKRFLLVLLVPVFMFTGAVLGCISSRPA